MTLTRNSASVITLQEAQSYVQAFNNKFPNATKAFFAGSDHFEAILNQQDCIGIRIYNGFNETENRTNLILVGVNENQEDMTTGIIVERLIPCPSICDVASPLYT